MKKAVAILMAVLMLVGMTACAALDEDLQGAVFNIYAYDTQFKALFEKYYTVPEGVVVNWYIYPKENGEYQQKLDEMLLNKEKVEREPDDMMDLFIADLSCLDKYVNSTYTRDISGLGFLNKQTQYEYTIRRASTVNGVVKGVAYNCVPAALIYRKSIAKDVLGTDDPNAVQSALATWEQFDAVAAKAKEKGYYMTASYDDTLRAFADNCTGPWVDRNNSVLQMNDRIVAWMDQAESFIRNGYTANPVLGNGKGDLNRCMCFYGPAYGYETYMTFADGDWDIVEGPETFIWDGTWLIGATGTDNPEMLTEIFNLFTKDEDVCTRLYTEEHLFPNNITVVEKLADGGETGLEPVSAIAKDIGWQNRNHTNYDQTLNEWIRTGMLDSFVGSIDRETALENFRSFVRATYINVVFPEELEPTPEP